MAALPDPGMLTRVDLRELRPEDLDPLLEEETAVWQRELDWDFTPSADLVRRFVRMQSLNGYALMAGDRIIGYSYYVCEDGKGLIGDVYVLREALGGSLETDLLDSVLVALWITPGVKRVESQLMMLSPAARRRMPFPGQLRAWPRNFLTIELGPGFDFPPGRAAGRVIIEPWHEREQEQAARLIARAYSGHVDSDINDQYRSVSGARKFLGNIVQYPGCGSFFQPGSFVALEPASGVLAGLTLASLVAFDSGHITQICVEPQSRHKGLGYELLRHSLASLARSGCRRASLTVTASNDEAMRLYAGTGFRLHRRFEAFVWEPPRR